MTDQPKDNGNIGHDFKITQIKRQALAAGTWVSGTLSGHRFDALVFPEHAINPDFELGTSRISELTVRRIADRMLVVNFDRGWDVEPSNTTARRIAWFLEENLADEVFGENA